MSPLQPRYASESSLFIGNLEPLPPVARRGLTAVVVFSFLSFVACAVLLAYLLYKLVRWNFRPVEPGESTAAKTATLGPNEAPQLADEHLCPGPPQPEQRPAGVKWALKRIRLDPPNQFLVLILNLLFADLQQALAFLLSVKWLAQDALRISSRTCWAQGWFVTVGNMASSVFIAIIAAHTYLAVVRGYRLPFWAFYFVIALSWVFIYITAALAAILTENGAGHGGLFVRAGAWCWISTEFQLLRLLLHYLWILILLAFTTFTYILIFMHIRKTARKSRHPHAHQDFTLAGRKTNNGRRSVSSADYATQPTFLLYPLAHVLCTAPLAAGRVATMAGTHPTLAYFCAAGAIIACNGWLDALLYASTRRSILFSDKPPSQDTGLNTFSYLRTPANRRFGNVVFVAGGVGATGRQSLDDQLVEAPSPSHHRRHHRQQRGCKKENIRRSLRKLTRLRGEAGQSDVSLWGVEQNKSGDDHVSPVSRDVGRNGLAIQLETVTTVVSEREDGGSRFEPRRRTSLGSDEVSFSWRV
ncbi:hypothetical protein ACRALDRAFT_2098986 [Sodiomyces alcalophilus JCM 7366]|uniref:uncharacterized protein n=1 Tax=Sodiomyces alcalophilus JCM 7366 TaxID=591952 RepID=UPI0039B49EA6